MRLGDEPDNAPAGPNVAQATKVAMSTLLIAALTLSPMDAEAAGRSGGRVGGRAPAMRSAPSRSYAPRTSSRTNIYVSPGIGYGGFGYGGVFPGYGYGFGGGPGLGTYLGLSLAETFLREQQRQAFLEQQLRTQQELGRDQAQIAALQQQLEVQRSRVDILRAEQEGKPSDSMASQMDTMPAEERAAFEQLMQQLKAQQKEIESLKAASK